MPKVTVHRKAHFNAAHRLYRKDWSDEKNACKFLANVAIRIFTDTIMI